MGGVYARDEGAPEPVWQAIYDQYLPAGSEDPLPRGRVACAASLIDRLDTLVGFFGLGPKYWPSGSKDPFGLRRAALGLVRLLLAAESSVDVTRLIAAAVSGYGDTRVDRSRDAHGNEKSLEGGAWALGPLPDFLRDRLEFLLGREGLAHDEVAAAFGADAEAFDVREVAARARAVRLVRQDPSFLSMVLSAKRIANILKDVEAGEVDPARLGTAAERELDAAARRFDGEVTNAVAARDFEAGLRAVGGLAAPLEKFFVDVLVMDPDAGIRANRLALLAGIHRGVRRLADLSAVVVDKAEYR
jgi:glycyl-tRNA synthetase beta chain